MSLFSTDPSTSIECLLSTDFVREVQGDGKKPLEKWEGCYQELTSSVINKTQPFKLDAFGGKIWKVRKRRGMWLLPHEGPCGPYLGI